MTDLIGVDWGSSSFRAFAIGRDTHDVRRADDGVLTTGGDFAARLRTHLRDWLARWPSAPVLLCGMIGSDRGWVRAPYVAAPAGLAELAAALTPAPFDRPVHIVPGVSFQEGASCEVMRGEETLLLGLGETDAMVCLPGTHSKWAELRGGRLVRFRTYMTGELRAALLASGALATDVPQTRSPAAFVAGLEAAATAPSTSALFQARARRLLGALAAEHAAAFVSGVLIGEEIARESDANIPVTLVARGALADDYAAALTHAGRRFTLVDPEPLGARGLAAIARHAGLTSGT